MITPKLLRHTWLLLVILLTACPLQTTPTTQDRIQAAKMSLMTAYKNIDALAQRSHITKAEGQQFIATADGISAALSVAQSKITAGSPSDATQILEAALTDLVALRAHIQEKQ